MFFGKIAFNLASFGCANLRRQDIDFAGGVRQVADEDAPADRTNGSKAGGTLTGSSAAPHSNSNSYVEILLKLHTEPFNRIFDGCGVINADILTFGTPDAIAGNHYASPRAGIFVQNFPRFVVASLQSDSA